MKRFIGCAVLLLTSLASFAQAQAPTATPAAAPAPTMDTAKIAQIAGHQGEQNGAVYAKPGPRDRPRFLATEYTMRAIALRVAAG